MTVSEANIGPARRRDPGGAPFDLADPAAYEAWRARKLAAYPAGAADLTVEIARLAAPSAREIRAVRDRCRAANMALYTCPKGADIDRETIRRFAAAFGLRRLDRHLLADESGITALRVAAEGRRRHYIPYSNLGLSWHSDGTYNEASRRVRAVVLHCARAAASGGENALLDPEIAYIHLRDADPAYIAALMHPEAMTIPANREDGVEIRPAVAGPVFSVDGGSGALHMRFSARARNIVWRDDPATRAARACLNELLADPQGPVIRCRLGAGQGIIGNNVLHDRTAFRDDGEGQRLVYRARFLDRIAGTDTKGGKISEATMLNLSDLIIQHPEVESFQDIVGLVRRRAEAGEILLHFDVKPDYVDTPRNWHWQLEAAFNRRTP